MREYDKPVPNRRRLVALCVVLFALVVVGFLPSTRNGFVNFDDNGYVYSNSHVQHGLTSENIRWAFTTFAEDSWHPLTWLSHMLDCQLYGLRPSGHHLTSLVLHAVNAVLLLLALTRLTGNVWPSALAAALFAFHPLHVETVAWASDRKDVLSALFWLLALLCYARYGATPRTSAPVKRFYGLAVFYFACALMSKPMVLTLPAILLLLDWWPLRRFDIHDLHNSRGTVVRLLAEKIPFVALGAIAAALSLHGGTAAGVVGTVSHYPIWTRIENALVSYVAYAGQMLWPANLAAFYPYPKSFPAWQVIGAALLLVLISGAVLSASRRRPYLAFGWIWFVVTLIPAIGLIQIGGQTRADRYTYLPLIGLFVLISWGLAELSALRASLRTPLIATALTAVAACIFLTEAQLRYWHDSETLFRRALAVTENNHVAYDNLGLHLWEQGRTDEAIENYNRSLALSPRFEPLNNLGLAQASQGRYADAIANYEAALQFRSNELATHKNLAEALARSEKFDDAIAHFTFILRATPEDLTSRNNLGICLMMRGRTDEAIAHFQTILRADINHLGAHGNLARAYTVQKKFPEAVEQYREVLRLNPDDARARDGLEQAMSENAKLNPQPRAP